MTQEILIKQMDALRPWHQVVQITNDLSTEIYNEKNNGRKMVSHFKHSGKFIYDIYKKNIINKTMLDCGCNAGAHLFGAAKLGIKSGLGFDAREHWINQANWLKKNITIYNTDNLEFKIMNIYDIPKNNIGNFDATMYSGLFYHVEEPFLSLKILSDVTNELLIINTAFEKSHDQNTNMDCLYFKSEGVLNPLSGVHGVSWLPSGEKVIVKMLQKLGFVEFYLMFKKADDSAEHNGRLGLAASKVNGLLTNTLAEAYNINSRKKLVDNQQK